MLLLEILDLEIRFVELLYQSCPILPKVSESNADFKRFLSYAQRSCSEVRSQLYVAFDQGYIKEAQFNELFEETIKCSSKIGAFIKYLKSKNC